METLNAIMDWTAPAIIGFTAAQMILLKPKYKWWFAVGCSIVLLLPTLLRVVLWTSLNRSPGFVPYNAVLVAGLLVLSLMRGKNNPKLNEFTDWWLGKKH